MADLSGLCGLVLGFLVPMLKVLVDGGLLGGSVLAHHGAETSLSGGGILVHCLVEGGIARVILGLEFCGSHCEGRWNFC